MATKTNGMPRSFSKRLMRRGAEKRDPVIVTFDRNGKPNRVFGHAEFHKMMELPHRVKPWERRKAKKEVPDPLGAVDAKPPAGLSRRDLYEDED
ncbi:MAG TPA: hypothetical protein VGB47_12980 [Thermoanaerobaculia bacterium]|jgi:hypothetical protein